MTGLAVVTTDPAAETADPAATGPVPHTVDVATARRRLADLGPLDQIGTDALRRPAPALIHDIAVDAYTALREVERLRQQLADARAATVRAEVAARVDLAEAKSEAATAWALARAELDRAATAQARLLVERDLAHRVLRAAGLPATPDAIVRAAMAAVRGLDYTADPTPTAPAEPTEHAEPAPDDPR